MTGDLLDLELARGGKAATGAERVVWLRGNGYLPARTGGRRQRPTRPGSRGAPPRPTSAPPRPAPPPRQPLPLPSAPLPPVVAAAVAALDARQAPPSAKRDTIPVPSAECAANALPAPEAAPPAKAPATLTAAAKKAARDWWHRWPWQWLPDERRRLRAAMLDRLGEGFPEDAAALLSVTDVLASNCGLSGGAMLRELVHAERIEAAAIPVAARREMPPPDAPLPP